MVNPLGTSIKTKPQTFVWGFFVASDREPNKVSGIAFAILKLVFLIMVRLFTFILLMASASTWANKDTTISVQQNNQKRVVHLSFPKVKAKGSILLLHGWNFPATQWCDKTNIGSLALIKGYVLIMPDLGKSTYHWQTYPETIEKYRSFPTRRWITDTLITALQNKFSLLLPGKNNFVAGLSTGGRGAALLALENPKIFKAAACLSADFDQRLLLNEPINTGFYGSQEKFPERWSGRDNIYLRAKEFNVPLLLIHGKLDKMCPYTQTENFVKELTRTNPALKVVQHIDENGSHTYSYWGSHSETILRFFDEHLK